MEVGFVCSGRSNVFMKPKRAGFITPESWFLPVQLPRALEALHAVARVVTLVLQKFASR